MQPECSRFRRSVFVTKCTLRTCERDVKKIFSSRRQTEAWQGLKGGEHEWMKNFLYDHKRLEGRCRLISRTECAMFTRVSVHVIEYENVSHKKHVFARFLFMQEKEMVVKCICCCRNAFYRVPDALQYHNLSFMSSHNILIFLFSLQRTCGLLVSRSSATRFWCSEIAAHIWKAWYFRRAATAFELLLRAVVRVVGADQAIRRPSDVGYFHLQF